MIYKKQKMPQEYKNKNMTKNENDKNGKTQKNEEWKMENEKK